MLSMMFVFKDKIASTYFANVTDSKKVVQAVATPKPTETPKPAQPIGQDQIEQLRKNLYQEGLSISAKVDKVYPGAGFTIVDDAGTKLFAGWAKAAPTQGQSVSIKGTIQKLSSADLDKQITSTPDLKEFLKSQKIFIEAKEVTVTP